MSFYRETWSIGKVCTMRNKDGTFVEGHRHLPLETRIKMGKAGLGNKNALGHIQGPITKLTRKRISKAHKGLKCSEETKQKISNALKGKVKSQEHKRKISISTSKSITKWWKNRKRGLSNCVEN